MSKGFEAWLVDEGPTGVTEEEKDLMRAAYQGGWDRGFDDAFNAWNQGFSEEDVVSL